MFIIGIAEALRRVRADGDNLITERVEVAFDCSQFTELRIAKWAPAASVENDYGRFSSKYAIKFGRFSLLIGEKD